MILIIDLNPGLLKNGIGRIEMVLSNKYIPVVKELLNGKISKQIAEDLHISKAKVDCNISELMDLFNVSNRIALVLYLERNKKELYINE